MKKLDKRLFRMIKNTKGQYIAVLSIIITGIFIFTAVKNSSSNLRDSLDEFYKETNFGDIFVSASSIPEGKEKYLIGKENIKDADLRLSLNTNLITDNGNENVRVRAVSIDKKENNINKLFIKKGKRQLSEREVIVIEQFAIARDIDVGSEIVLNIKGRQYRLRVAAIASSPEYVYMMENEQVLLPDPVNFGLVFIEENYLRKISGTSNFNELVIAVKDYDQIEITKDYLEKELKRYGVYSILDKGQQLSNSMMTEEINGLEKVSKSVPIVFLLFAGIMLAIMLSRIVKKDRSTIGVLKACGFTDGEIINHYLKYALSVGVIGGITGSIIGTVTSGLMTNMYLEFFNIPMMRVKFYYDRIIIALILSVLFCASSGFWGIKNILSISPAEAMMPEPPKSGKRIILERCSYFWNRLTFSWRMVYRNIFREKRKFLVTVAAISITVSMMIMTVYLSNLMDLMFVKHYTEFMKMEYNISFNGFKDERVLKEIKSNINFTDIEGRTEIPFEVKNGRHTKIVNIVGLKEDTKFYDFYDLNKNKLNISKNGMLISSNLASSLNVNKGDEIILKSFYSEDEKYIRVSGIIKQSLGINGYINIDYLNNEFLDKGIINGVYINSNDNVEYKLKNIKSIAAIQSQDNMKDIFKEFTGLIVMFIGMMVIFSGMLGFIILYSMTIMSINERSLEFSTLRVMGFTKKEIFKMLIKENIVMTVIGVIVGIPMGKVLTFYLGQMFSTDIYTLQENIKYSDIISAIILTVVFIILAQLITYVKIHKLDFMSALKSRIS